MRILTKNLLETFSYSTINQDRSGEMIVKINGRDYIKLGTYQAVTLVGNLYEIYDADVKSYKTVLFVGATKQHPRDIMVNKELAYEEANLKSLLNPTIIMEVGPNFCQHDFRRIASTYVDTLNLKFVKTRQEIDEIEFEKSLDYLFTCGEEDNYENIPE